MILQRDIARLFFCCFNLNPIGPFPCAMCASLRKVQASHCRRDGIAGAGVAGGLGIPGSVRVFVDAQIGCCCCLSWHL